MRARGSGDGVLRGGSEVNISARSRTFYPFIGVRADIYHGEVTLPRGVAAAVAKRARPLQGIAAALAAVQGDVLLAPRHPASAKKEKQDSERDRREFISRALCQLRHDDTRDETKRGSRLTQQLA